MCRQGSGSVPGMGEFSTASLQIYNMSKVAVLGTQKANQMPRSLLNQQPVVLKDAVSNYYRRRREWFYSLLQAPTVSTMPLHWFLSRNSFLQFLIWTALKFCSALSSYRMGGGGVSHFVSASHLAGIYFICSRQVYEVPHSSWHPHCDYIGFISLYNSSSYRIWYVPFSLMGLFFLVFSCQICFVSFYHISQSSPFICV